MRCYQRWREPRGKQAENWRRPQIILAIGVSRADTLAIAMKNELDQNQITRILHEARVGDRGAIDRLLPLIYDELRALAARQMARERPDHTLQTTALVHEAY